MFYRGIDNVVFEIYYSSYFLSQKPHPSIVICDNVSVIYLSDNLLQYKRRKQIEIDVYFV